jgi:membrane protein
VFGAAGSLVILLLWIYYSAQILFFGAEFTQVHARYRGVQILPNEHAVRVREVKEEAGSGNEAEKEKGAPKRPPRTARPETRRA